MNFQAIIIGDEAIVDEWINYIEEHRYTGSGSSRITLYNSLNDALLCAVLHNKVEILIKLVNAGAGMDMYINVLNVHTSIF